jgi:hypothetical protein
MDHVLWGTASIWHGTPQWQMEAFRLFQIHDQLIEMHQYQPLTRRAKEQVFRFNLAGIFGVDVEAKRREVPNDALGRLRNELSGRWAGAEPKSVRMGGGMMMRVLSMSRPPVLAPCPV